MMLFSLLWSGSIGAQTVEQDSIDMIEIRSLPMMSIVW